MKTTSALLSMTLLSSILITGCGGGGGGGSLEELRRPESVIYLSADSKRLVAAPDDGSVDARTLSGPVISRIRDFQVSPDGEYVAYIADQDVAGQMDLYVAEIDGEAPIKVSQLNQTYSDVEDFNWSPGSRKLAYRADDRSTDNQLSLYAVNVDGTGFYEVAYLSGYVPSVFVDPQYAWSPDGHHLAWILDEPTYRQFSLWADDTREMTQAMRYGYLHQVTGTATKEILSFKWSPDSYTLAFRTDDFNSNDDQYGIAVVTHLPGAVAGVANGAPGDTVQIVDYQWSPDSRMLAQTVHAYPLVENRVGINTYDLTSWYSYRVVTTANFGELRWAHNSNKLAFVAAYDVDNMRASTQRALIVFDADTLIMDDINNDPARNEILSDDDYFWSPDDSQIAYLSDMLGTERAYVVNSDGIADATQLDVPVERGIESLNWSNDGRHLGLLSLNINAAFHPGNWHIFDNTGQSVWTSPELNTYESSLQMKWAYDMKKVVYAGAGQVSTTDTIYSLDLGDLSSIEIHNNASTDPAFDYAEESLIEVDE